MNFLFVGVALAALGGAYVRYPDLFRRGIWKRTAISQRLLSPEGNRRYMRGLGVVLIAVGLALIVLGIISPPR
jgi:hypothetical protein